MAAYITSMTLCQGQLEYIGCVRSTYNNISYYPAIYFYLRYTRTRYVVVVDGDQVTNGSRVW